MHTVTPAPKGSVFDLGKNTCTIEGLTCESTEMSRGPIMYGLNDSREGHVNSPARRKPKNPKQHAAHNIEALKESSSGQADQVVKSNSGVTGERGAREVGGGHRRMPRKTQDRNGLDANSGSGRPLTTCRKRIPLRYTLIVGYETPELAKCATKRAAVIWEIGRGDTPRGAQKL